MTDYSKLTDAQINRIIMERLGYKAEWYDQEMPPGKVYRRFCRIANSKGVIISGGWESEEDAWKYADLPNRAGDLNEALWLDVPFKWVLRQALVGNQWCAAPLKSINFTGEHIDIYMELYTEASTASRAICEAWLKWHDLPEEVNH